MTQQRLRELLVPFVAGAGDALYLPEAVYEQLSVYLDLILRWNARTNLTAVRNPEEIVTRHFGESLFAAMKLVPFLGENDTLLDYGSGAGFPGMPIQLALPNVSVTLAESQGKKAAFLREAVRVLGLATTVWAERVETMPADRRFHAVTLRAVDRMEEATRIAVQRLLPGGVLCELVGRSTEGTSNEVGGLIRDPHDCLIPGSDRRTLRMTTFKRPSKNDEDLFHVEQRGR